MEFREGDRLEGSAHTPMYNPHILPLRFFNQFKHLTSVIYVILGDNGILEVRKKFYEAPRPII